MLSVLVDQFEVGDLIAGLGDVDRRGGWAAGVSEWPVTFTFSSQYLSESTTTSAAMESPAGVDRSGRAA